MKIPFSLPVIDQDVIDEMMDTLTRTGWLTSGPKVHELETEIGRFTGNPYVLCVNSWTSGAMLMMRWFEISPGDEIIVPAYTYTATALSVMNMGAIPVMVDVRDDFTIDPEKIRAAITERTKMIIPVDLAGYPADYDAIYSIVNDPNICAKFKPCGKIQKQFGRIMVMADAAHSIGATYHGVPVGQIADLSVFSLHSVKNITTGEGGAVLFHLPESFDSAATVKYCRVLAINGQNKNAYEKNQPGAWRYDIIAQGLKANMPDLCASVGLSQIRRYRDVFLPERKRIFNYYKSRLSKYDWAVIPPDLGENGTETSYHLFLLRIRNFKEEQRDRMISCISTKDVGVNVHYIPMAMLTMFREKGYRISDYPETFNLYCNEITLPLYNNLTEDKLKFIVDTLIDAYYTVISDSSGIH